MNTSNEIKAMARKLCEISCGPMPKVPKAYQHKSPYLEALRARVAKPTTKCTQFTGTADNVSYRIEKFIREYQTKPGFRILNQTQSQACEGVTVIITYTVME